MFLEQRDETRTKSPDTVVNPPAGVTRPLFLLEVAEGGGRRGRNVSGSE